MSDGDTLILGTGEKVRLVAVDAPEMTGGGECFAQQATDYTRDLFEGATVCLWADPLQPDKDEFGRLLRNVFYKEPAAGDQLVLHDARMVRLGLARPHYAFVFNTTFAENTVFMALQAQAEGIGGWGACADWE